MQNLAPGNLPPLPGNSFFVEDLLTFTLASSLGRMASGRARHR